MLTGLCPSALKIGSLGIAQHTLNTEKRNSKYKKAADVCCGFEVILPVGFQGLLTRIAGFAVFHGFRRRPLGYGATSRYCEDSDHWQASQASPFFMASMEQAVFSAAV